MPGTMIRGLVAALALGTALACEPQPREEAQVEPAPELGAAPEEAPGPAAGAAIEVRDKEGLGEYLTDTSGRSLYLFLADTVGTAGRTSTCYNACAEAWPPLLVEGEPVAGGPEVQEQLLGTIQRRDGAMQVTYNGWPLYYYAPDENPGDTKGQDIEGFGAEWYLVTPDGAAVGHGEEEGS